MATNTISHVGDNLKKLSWNGIYLSKASATPCKCPKAHIDLMK